MIYPPGIHELPGLQWSGSTARTAILVDAEGRVAAIRTFEPSEESETMRELWHMFDETRDVMKEWLSLEDFGYPPEHCEESAGAIAEHIRELRATRPQAFCVA